MNHWMKRGAWAVLGLAAWGDIAMAQDAPAKADVKGARQREGSGDLLGPFGSVQDLKDIGKMVFKLGDLDNDGLISQQEATDSANAFVGGIFFRADTNGDGIVSKEEASQARDAFLKQKPFLRAISERAQRAKAGASGNESKAKAAGNPMKMLGSLLDVNNDGQLQAAEVRKATQTAVQGLYETADTDKDAQLSSNELNTAMGGMVTSVMQSVIQNADSDHNGSLSEGEFDKVVQSSADVVFRVLDANGDGQLSGEETQEARRLVGKQLKIFPVLEPMNGSGAARPRPTRAEPAPTRGGDSANAPRSR